MKEELRISGMQRELSGDYIFILPKARSTCHFLPNMNYLNYFLTSNQRELFPYLLHIYWIYLVGMLSLLQEKVTLCYIIQWSFTDRGTQTMLCAKSHPYRGPPQLQSIGVAFTKHRHFLLRARSKCHFLPNMNHRIYHSMIQINVSYFLIFFTSIGFTLLTCWVYYNPVIIYQ